MPYDCLTRVRRQFKEGQGGCAYTTGPDVRMLESKFVSFAGEYDLSRSLELEERLRPLETCPSVVVDLREVTFIDAACIGVFIQMQVVRLGQGFAAPTALVQKTGFVRRVLDIVNFGGAFHMVDGPNPSLQGRLLRGA